MGATIHFQITVVAAVEPFQIRAALGPSGLQIEWHATAGVRSHVEFKNNLSQADWSELPGDITATSNEASKLDITWNQMRERYYRVRIVP